MIRLSEMKKAWYTSNILSFLGIILLIISYVVYSFTKNFGVFLIVLGMIALIRGLSGLKMGYIYYHYGGYKKSTKRTSFIGSILFGTDKMYDVWKGKKLKIYAFGFLIPLGIIFLISGLYLLFHH